METIESAREWGRFDRAATWQPPVRFEELGPSDPDEEVGEDFVSGYAELLRHRIALLELTLTSDPTQADLAAVAQQVEDLRAGAQVLGAQRVAAALARLSDPQPRADTSVVCWRLLRELRTVLRAIHGDLCTT